MMRYLLDVNVLVAWGWYDHSDHRRTAAWIGSKLTNRQVTFFTSAIPELGFVRVSVQRTAGWLSVEDAASVLDKMMKSLGKRHQFLADDRSAAAGFPDWCQSASRTTDGHLLDLAERHSLKLATLDESIPGAFLIPR